jgi:hypothetical protein
MAVASLLALLVGCEGEVSSGTAFAAGGEGGTTHADSSNEPDAGAGGMAGSGASGGAGGDRGSEATGGTPDGAGGQASSPPADSVPMFVAQGHLGRTIISCDDGKTWVADQSASEAWGYCNDNDCDHDPGAGRGITWADGWFFATFGWGRPGQVIRSRDGVSWETVFEGRSFGGIVYGNGRLVAAHRTGLYSDDQGESWQEFGDVELTVWNVRDAAFIDHDGGRFIMTAHDGYSEIVVSRDGVSWTQPPSVPPNCGGGAYQGHILYGQGTIVMAREDGIVCYSKDGGETWTSKSIADAFRANPVWTGSEFMVWNRGTLYRSADGETWTQTPIVPSDIDLGATAVAEGGTFVGVTNHWQQHYDAQIFYRSEDGVHWEALDATAYTGGHPIKLIAFGYGQPSELCSP